MFIIGTRLPSQWLGGSVATAAQALEEGNPLDRTISSVLILLAIGILMSRSFKWGDLFGRNLALTAFLAFALLSVFWSDFPFIAFKRWFRDLGNYLVILVALTDPPPPRGCPYAVSTAVLSADPPFRFACQVLPRDRQTIRLLERHRDVCGTYNEQEHARRAVPDQRSLLLLGHGGALVRAQEPADEDRSSS